MGILCHSFHPRQALSLLFSKKEVSNNSAVAGRYDIAEFENTFGYDPDDSSLLLCVQFPPQGFNIDFYCNHTLDALYRQELETVDLGVRRQIFQHIHRIYLTEFPFIVLYSETDFAISRKGTHNYQTRPINGETINIWEGGATRGSVSLSQLCWFTTANIYGCEILKFCPQ